MSRRYTFENDIPDVRSQTEAMMNADFDRMRDRFYDRTRNMRQDQDRDFDRWFEHGEHEAFQGQPHFKIPKEDERSAYVRNIPIFQEDDSSADGNLMRQTTSAIPKSVPPPTQHYQSPPLKSSPPPTSKPKEFPHQRVSPPLLNGTNSAANNIDRQASRSPSVVSDSQSNSSATNPPRPEKKDKIIPIKVDVIKPETAIPMGFVPKQRDPKEAIPLGFERPASAPGEGPVLVDKQPPTFDAKEHRVPMLVKQEVSHGRSASAPPKRSETSPPPTKVRTPLERIANTVDEVRKLEERITRFRGSRKEHEYRLLDELLTQAILKLDDVPVDGNEEVRNARKNAVKDVTAYTVLLERSADQLPALAAQNQNAGSPAVDKSTCSSFPATTRIVIPFNPNKDEEKA